MAGNDIGKTDRTTKVIAWLQVALLTIVVLALNCGFFAWHYQHSRAALEVQARQSVPPLPAGTESALAIAPVMAELDGWAFRQAITAMAGSSVVLVLAVFGASARTRLLRHRLSDTTREAESCVRKLEQTTTQLQYLQNQRRQLEAELDELKAQMDQRVEERTIALSKTFAQLEAELNERKAAEKALAQQAQELGRSKDVLELHVQARTQELQKLKSRYELILNSAGEGIYGLDLQGRTTFVNPAAAKLTGWKVEELAAKTEEEIFHTGGNPDQVAWITRSGEQVNEQVFRRKDGTTFPVEYVRTSIVEKNRLVGAVVIFKDITERKRTEEALARKAAELARSNSELEQFAYVASHDLQEPLRKIQAFGDRLKSKCDAIQLQDGRDYLDRMQNAAARMQRLINDLLSFSRVMSARQPFVPVDLNAVTREVLTDLEVRIEQTKADVKVEQLPTIEADPLQVRQLLQNLIGNALKFQPPDAKPVVEVKAQILQHPFASGTDPSPHDEVCELSIHDNGIGFEEKYVDKIFGMFQRLHGRNSYEGTGVGLAICRRIVDRHGGTIAAKSKPGKGSTFMVCLPVHQTGSSKAPAAT